MKGIVFLLVAFMLFCWTWVFYFYLIVGENTGFDDILMEVVLGAWLLCGQEGNHVGGGGGVIEVFWSFV